MTSITAASGGDFLQRYLYVLDFDWGNDYKQHKSVDENVNTRGQDTNGWQMDDAGDSCEFWNAPAVCLMMIGGGQGWTEICYDRNNLSICIY